VRGAAVQWLLLGGLLCLSVVLCFSATKLIQLDARIAALFERDPLMQTIKQEVTRPSGAKVIVETVRKEGEGIVAWIARHDAVVDALTAN
jgi:hypothetical protein